VEAPPRGVKRMQNTGKQSGRITAGEESGYVEQEGELIVKWGSGLPHGENKKGGESADGNHWARVGNRKKHGNKKYNESEKKIFVCEEECR